MQIPPPFLRLPVELHLQIASCLDPKEDGSVLCLRLTTRYFYDTIAAPDHNTLLSIELTEWARQRSLYTCKFCVTGKDHLGLRQKSKFADAMLKGKTGINGSCRKNRFCADCGFEPRKPQLYQRGEARNVGGQPWVLCHRCGKLKKGREVLVAVCNDSCKVCHQTFGCSWPKGHARHCTTGLREDPPIVLRDDEHMNAPGVALDLGGFNYKSDDEYYSDSSS